jgi:2-polyprenyl-6-hydroxyphenyl methylase/3-demethylubiquinone-9 3-methyltransferase
VCRIDGLRVTLIDVARRTPAMNRARNDPSQYDDLAGEWWRPNGQFCMLHWLAEARAALVRPASRPDAVLVDLGCGAGLMAPYLAGKGYRHVGVDVTRSALDQAADHGVTAIQGDACRVPLADGCADVVTAGEILEHVVDVRAAIGEACRVLRPGGQFVADTLNATATSRFVAVTLGERIPGGAPPGIHDPNLFVAPRVLVDECARHGVQVRIRGIRPAAPELFRFMMTRRGVVPIVPTRSVAILYQAVGVKASD